MGPRQAASPEPQVPQQEGRARPAPRQSAISLF